MALTPAQLLDELMGPNRNALPNEAKSELHWSDDNVRYLQLNVVFGLLHLLVSTQW